MFIVLNVKLHLHVFLPAIVSVEPHGQDYEERLCYHEGNKDCAMPVLFDQVHIAVGFVLA